ncbi:carbohydrate porin [Beijerinckia mobilis]|uniref:carbohydrate porin n=1 Tax=Beijerinckia mobilis TaxID=231434 RepID=UPI000A077167
MFKNQTILGLIVTGPFESRKEDTFGVVGSYIRLGPHEVDYLQASRYALGGRDLVKSAEEIFEINYGHKIARGIRINPKIQYVLNPDNILKPAALHQSNNIFAFGVRLSVELGAVLGFPVWH